MATTSSNSMARLEVTLPKAEAPRRGEMVAWTPPAIAGTTCLKRVIGLPGEQVRWRLWPFRWRLATNRLARAR